MNHGVDLKIAEELKKEPEQPTSAQRRFFSKLNRDGVINIEEFMKQEY